MKYSRKSSKVFLFPLLLMCVTNPMFIINEALAEGAINSALLLGEWKLIALYDVDVETVKVFDTKLKNGIIFTDKKLTEVTQLRATDRTDKRAHKYSIEGNCVMLHRLDENVCWHVNELTKNKLILDTPNGVYTYEK